MPLARSVPRPCCQHRDGDDERLRRDSAVRRRRRGFRRSLHHRHAPRGVDVDHPCARARRLSCLRDGVGDVVELQVGENAFPGAQGAEPTGPRVCARFVGGGSRDARLRIRSIREANPGHGAHTAIIAATDVSDSRVMTFLSPWNPWNP